ncbi:MAG: ATP-binding cassette domain-containing protein [Pseudomonadota bacterium]
MTQAPPDSLYLKEITISLKGKRLIAVKETIQPGQVLTVMGPSGSGKSSLLAYIGGFLAPVFKAHGKVFCGVTEITALPPQKRKAGLLFQDPLLFPHMSVGRNLAFAAPSTLSGRDARRACALQMLHALDLPEYIDADPDTLSGGQKARVALGRVLMSEPSYLLLDEPFSKLDMALRDQMRALVFNRARERQLPVVLVTHDQADADAAGGPVIHVDAN